MKAVAETVAGRAWNTMFRTNLVDGGRAATLEKLCRQSFFSLQTGDRKIDSRLRRSAFGTPAKLEKPGRRLAMALSASVKKPVASRRIAKRFSRQEQIRRLIERQQTGASYNAYRRKILSFARLPKGWNTYFAEAPGTHAIELAHDFIDLAEQYHFKIDWLAPSVDDSVMMTVDTRSGKQEWEFFGDGGTAVMYRDAGGKKNYVDLEKPEFEQFLLGKQYAKQ